MKYNGRGVPKERVDVDGRTFDDHLNESFTSETPAELIEFEVVECIDGGFDGKNLLFDLVFREQFEGMDMPRSNNDPDLPN